MSIDSSLYSSTSSAKSRRFGKSVAEKIRELGFNLRHQPIRTTLGKMQSTEIKIEKNRSLDFIFLTPNLNLEQIVYYQPQISLDEFYSTGKSFYKIEKFETKSVGPKEKIKISDIEVKSFKPLKRIKFQKKRHSSIIKRIEDILNKGKNPLPNTDPSDEFIVIDYEIEERAPKDINDLSKTILQKIFFYLSQKERFLILPRVCKSWYYALKDPMFWTELEFKGNEVPSNTIIHLIKKYPFLKKLRLTSVLNTVEILQELCRCNNTITYLGVRHCDVGNHDFARIIFHVISCCTNLEVLDIKGMRFQSKRFYLELGRLKNLKSLNLTGNTYLSNQDLITLSVNCRNLKDLRILDMPFDYNNNTAFKDEDLAFILSHLEHNLQIFKIDMQNFGNASYQAILKCLSLTQLALKNCLLLTSDLFQQFSVLTNLKKLKITRAINIKPEDFQLLFEKNTMQNIEDLDISGCWGVGALGLQAITQKLPFLTSLSLKNCKSIKGDDLKLLSNCPKLATLNLAHMQIDTHQLLSLHQYAKNLRNLVIEANMSKKSTVRQLRKCFSHLIIKLSYSELKKEEKLLDDF